MGIQKHTGDIPPVNAVYTKRNLVINIQCTVFPGKFLLVHARRYLHFPRRYSDSGKPFIKITRILFV